MEKQANAILAAAAASPVHSAAMVANCVAYSADGKRIGDISLDAISDVLERPDTFVWVGLIEPDEALLEKLQEEFGLHDLAIEDAHNAHQRPKIEAYGDSLFIVAQTAQVVDAAIQFGETHIFVGKRYLVTVRHGASLSYAPARRSCEQSPEMLSFGPSYGLYAVLDFIVDNLLPIVRDFREELQQLEQDIFAETRSAHCRTFSTSSRACIRACCAMRCARISAMSSITLRVSMNRLTRCAKCSLPH